MRAVRVELAGMSYDMPVNFLAMQRLVDSVGCPVDMAVKAKGGAVSWNSVQVAKIIHVGVTSAGSTGTLEQIGSAMLEGHGLLHWLGVAAEYIGAFVAVGPEVPTAPGPAEGKALPAG